MMNHFDFKFQANKETLQGTIDFFENKKPEPTILSIHGAGPSNRNLIRYLTVYLAKFGFCSLRFDFSGHPESSGLLSNSSLKKRVDETLIATNFLKPYESYTLIATSMGGHIALEILPLLNIQNLILFCPAAYSQRAYEMPFNENFSNIIREPKSYLNATVFNNLKNYNGRLLFFVGSEDKIIPQEVIELYKSSSINCIEREFVMLDKAPHAIHAWLQKNNEKESFVLSKVLNFINQNKNYGSSTEVFA